MGKRQYNQYCPLAYSLDIIGERWTLLIVRDLIFGPRRYSDLLAGLPGIGTNLLANRLKALEAANIIVQQQLPPPSASTVYALTEHGRGLQKVITAIAEWGMDYVSKPPPDDDYLGVVPTMGAIKGFFNPENTGDTHVTCEFHAQGEVFHVSLDSGMLEVAPGAASSPDVVVAIDLKTLLNLVHGMADFASAISSGKLTVIRGDINALERFIAAYQRT
jgi:DNA-binding HxlR family transcriptional regulator